MFSFALETATASLNSACEIGIIKVEESIIVKKFHSLIKPPNNEYSRTNTLVHGINSELTKNAPTFNILWHQIKNYFKGNLVLAHNVNFDLGVLKQTLNYYGLDCPGCRYDCTYEIYGHSLSEVCKCFKIDFQHHNALSDALACAQIYLNYLNGVKPELIIIEEEEEKSLYDFRGHERIKGNVLKPNFEIADCNNPFYRKKVVITGIFDSISRQEIAQILKDRGADVDTSVSEKTDIIISGREPGPSKLRKVDALKAKGHKIIVASETDFLNMVK